MAGRVGRKGGRPGPSCVGAAATGIPCCGREGCLWRLIGKREVRPRGCHQASGAGPACVGVMEARVTLDRTRADRAPGSQCGWPTGPDSKRTCSDGDAGGTRKGYQGVAVPCGVERGAAGRAPPANGPAA